MARFAKRKAGIAIKIKLSQSQRSLDTSDLAFSSLFIHMGVTKSHITAHWPRAKSRAGDAKNFVPGGFQKKPIGHPSLSHSSRCSLYSWATTRSNATKRRAPGVSRSTRVAKCAKVLISNPPFLDTEALRRNNPTILHMRSLLGNTGSAYIPGVK